MTGSTVAMGAAGGGVRRLVLDRARTLDLTAAVLVAGVLLVYAANERPWLDRVCYLGVLVVAALSACLAAETAPRDERRAPRLVAAGLAFTALGDVLWEVVALSGASTDVSVADPAWFASYVTLCAAMWVVLSRSRPSQRVDAGFVIDAVTVVAVSVLVFWQFSIATIVADSGVSPAVRTVWASYPVADAVLLALVVRVLLSPRARVVLGGGFGLGVALWLAADVAYLRMPSGRGELLMDAAWMVAPVLMARAVWHWRPAPASDAAPTATTSLAPLVIAVVPLFVPPGLELVGDLRGEPDNPALLVTGSLVLVLLAFLRTARLIRSERTVRQALEEARDAALAGSRAKSMFVATMSHEIRTPLTTVLATAEMLEETDLDDDQRHLVARMRRSGSMLHALVEDVLDFSRIESGHVQMAATTFDLRAFVDQVAEGYGDRAGRAGLSFTCRVDPGTPTWVVGDPGRLSQVVGNLLDNALKFTDEGGIRLHVRCDAGSSVPQQGTLVPVELVVADTGVGIPPDRLGTVLDAFEQADGSDTRRHGGVGLGLAICRELVTRMGGSLAVRSDPGLGSEFVATVALRVASASDDGGTREPTGPKVPTAGASALVTSGHPGAVGP